MIQGKRALLPIILALALLSCKVFQPRAEATATSIPAEATAAPEATATRQPSATPEPTRPVPSETAAPSETSPASETPDSIPSATVGARRGGNGTSTDEWKDIPIYPGATDLSDEGETLSYTVEASMEDLVAFYEKNMEDLGWKKYASGDAESMFEIYEKGSRIAVITAMDGFAVPGTLLVVIAVQ